MLIKSIDTLKLFVTIAANADLKDFTPIMLYDTEPNVIVPVIGSTLFTEINGAVNDNDGVGLNNLKKDLLKLTRYVVANHALLQFVPLGRVTMAKGGITVELTDTTRSASAEQVADVKSQLQQNISAGVENLYAFLELNKGALASWVSSDAYTLQRRNFINSATEFSLFFAINNNRQFFQRLRPIMSSVESDKILAIVGKELFDLLKTQIKDGNVSVNNLKLMGWIRNAVAKTSIMDACKQFNIEFAANGLKLSYESQDPVKKSPADEKQLLAVLRYCEEQAENNFKMLTDFLFANADDYPLYKSSSAYVAPVDFTSVNESGKGIAMF